jgi:hypothetical protein
VAAAARRRERASRMAQTDILEGRLPDLGELPEFSLVSSLMVDPLKSWRVPDSSRFNLLDGPPAVFPARL